VDVAGVSDLQWGFLTLEKWPAIFVVALFSYINFRGASETGKAGALREEEGQAGVNPS
jgi:hypothetical protein